MFSAITLPKPQICALLLLAFTCLPRQTLETLDEDETDRLFHEGADHKLHNHNPDATTTAPRSDENPMPKDKILLNEVKSLTFIRNKRTTSRRTHSIHQLSCVGGTAGCKLFTPTLVECYNRGTDKANKVVWSCRADMSDRVKFNHVDIICEGYDYPEDDYILVGSCGLEFTLDYADPHDYHDKSYFKHMDDHEKELHHERVLNQTKPSNLASIVQWLFALIADHSIFLLICLVFISFITLVRFGLYSGARSKATTDSSRSKKRQQLGGSGYGPLTSAVMTTKKAC